MNTDTALINSMIDVRQVAEQAGAIFRNNRSRCPIHGGDNAQAFEIWDGGRAWKCHTRAECNQYGHDGIALLRILNNWTFQQVTERYAQSTIDPQEAARRAAENARRVEQDLQRKIEEAQKAIDELRKARRWLEDHERLTNDTRKLWDKRGIPTDWQNYYKLGYRQSFSYSYGGQFYTSPTLTIPIFAANENEPRDVKHRILNPCDQGVKYMHERKGLKAIPFLGDRDLPLDAADRVIVCEGEIKAAVTYLTLDRPLYQVVGIQGKEQCNDMTQALAGRNDTVIVLDPDAKKEAVTMARSLGGAYVVDLPEKIDDMIINYKLGAGWLETVFHNARYIK